MNYFRILFAMTMIISACVDRRDIKKEIADYHICVTKCDEIENTNTFNFFKCSQDCIDLYDKKKLVCNTLDASIREKGMVEIMESRNQCIERCQEKVVSVRAEIRDQIKRCKEICIYNLKK